MKTLKLFFAITILAAGLEFAGSNSVQARPTSTFQISVRIGDRPHRRYYRRPVIVRRPVYRRWHRRPVWHGRPGWRRPYRRY